MKSLIAYCRNFLAKVPPSDRVIIIALSLVFVFSLVLAVFAVEKNFLVEVPRKGGSLHEGILGTPRFINPLLALTDVDRDLSRLTHAGLMGISPDGSLIPVLAESYEISEDKKVYTFTLKDNLLFSDGTHLSASDIVFTVQKAQDATLKSPELSNWSNIRVEAPDDKTVVFTLPKPYAPFLEDATLGVIPEHLYKEISNEQFPFSPYMSTPTGAGPYKVASVVKDKKGLITSMKLAANKNYPLGRPYLDTIQITFFAQEEDIAEALKAGRIESAHSVVGDVYLEAPYSRTFGVFFNGSSNPLFNDIAVRKALSIAINRDELIENALGGFASPLYGPVPPRQDIALVAPDAAFGDIAEARATLERNGWTVNTETNVYTHKDKGELSFTLRTSNVAELKLIASEMKRVWETLPARVTVELFEQGDLTQTVIRPRDYEALLFGMVIDRGIDLYAFWSSSGRNDPGLNIALYTNSDVDDLLESIRQETDEAKKIESLITLNTLVAEEYPAVFTHVPDFVYTVPKDLKGVTLPHVTTPSDRFADVSHWYRKTEFVWPIFNNTFWR